MTLAERSISYSYTAEPKYAGRRLRVFATGVGLQSSTKVPPYLVILKSDPNRLVLPSDLPITYGMAYTEVQQSPELRALFEQLPLRTVNMYRKQNVYSLDELPPGDNAELHDYLQDLADDLAEDLKEALVTFREPDLYYPGVDVDIEPVSESHIELVLAAWQRELNRETRNLQGQNCTPKLPAPPLAKLPVRVQRALVERRRFRYAQWGIGRQQWEQGTYSLWDVHEDPDWIPRRGRR